MPDWPITYADVLAARDRLQGLTVPDRMHLRGHDVGDDGRRAVGYRDLEQVFVERDLPQPVFGKSDEFFAQFLKGVLVSLSGAF